MALLGCVDTISRRLVEGWAVNPEAHGETLQIEIQVNGDVAAVVDADIQRNDLKDFVPEDFVGTHGFRHVFDPPLSAFRPVQISVRVIGSAEHLGDYRRVIPAQQLSPGAMTPIILTSSGRSGTTLLMRELLDHPEIAAANLFPYEIKLSAYYAAVYRTLVANEDRENSTDPEHMFDGLNQYRVGHNPYNSPGFFRIIEQPEVLQTLFEHEFPRKIAELFQNLILDYYDITRKDQKKPDASFFAEKGDLEQDCRDCVRMLFGKVREIVMVRDPRDLLCSAKAFWKLGSADALEILSHTLMRLTEIGSALSGDMHILRYEDLLLAPELTRFKLYSFIGVDVPSTADSGAAPIFNQHGTSASPQESVARWRRDLTSGEIASCDSLFGDYMRLYGYLPSATLLTSRPTSRLTRTMAREQLERLTKQPNEERIRIFEFNKDHPENCEFLHGFSIPEAVSVWSEAPQCEIRLPLDGFAVRAVDLIIKPFAIEEQNSPLPQQRVTTTINGTRFDTCAVREYSLISFELESGRSSGDTLEIDLEFPDASCPRDFMPEHPDMRLLGFELHQIVLHGKPTTARRRSGR